MYIVRKMYPAGPSFSEELTIIYRNERYSRWFGSAMSPLKMRVYSTSEGLSIPPSAHPYLRTPNGWLHLGETQNVSDGGTVLFIDKISDLP
jgi:hypothetical protein